ncbi:hypothetical protein JS578_02820 [Dysgonomonadaceae bacterium zrk40]|nr:hypothetical protein JS578_02820 [Dysgonomonadaceae bacterium zrk40]
MGISYFKNNDLIQAFDLWISIAPLSTQTFDRTRLARVAYLSVLHNEFMSIEMLSELTNRSVDDEEVKETIVAYEAMVYMCDFLFDNGILDDTME